MAQGKRLLLMGLLLATTLLCLVKIGMENSFGYYFVTNQSIWWQRPSLMPIEIHIMKEIVSSKGNIMS
jgi:hypothetical protein